MLSESEPSDALLMERVARGDREAFAEVIRRHQALALAIACRFLGNRSEAEDAAQEVFLRLWRAAPRYRAAAPLPAYLRTLTVNYCLDVKRSPALYHLPDGAEPPGGPDPHVELAASERKAAVARAIRSLPTSQRMAVVLFHLEGLSVREVAQLLDTSPKATESLLSRARTALREKLIR